MYALEGIRVLDMAQYVAGPGTSMYLADQGAEVIKIEPVGRGDGYRNQSTTPFLGNNSLGFMTANRNKQSITLDFRKAEGREVLSRLVARADILVHNFRVGVAEKYGLDYEALSKENPRLVYANLTAFGSKGPYRRVGGYDRIIQGFSGSMFRRAADGTPISTGVYAADGAAPMLMAYGIMCALWVRERTGRGQKVETSLLHVSIALQMGHLSRADDDPDPRPEDTGDGGFGTYRCADGRFVTIAALADAEFIRLCQALGLAHLADDPRLSDPFAKRAFRAKELYPLLNERFKEKGSEEWLEILRTADVPCAPVLERREVVDHPQIVENEMIAAVEHAKAGRTRILGVPLRLSETPGAIRSAAPLLGEHTDVVLRALGYTLEEIEALRERGVV